MVKSFGPLRGVVEFLEYRPDIAIILGSTLALVVWAESADSIIEKHRRYKVAKELIDKMTKTLED